MAQSLTNKTNKNSILKYLLKIRHANNPCQKCFLSIDPLSVSDLIKKL